MENCTVLFKEIGNLECELNNLPDEGIDINIPDWMEKAKAASILPSEIEKKLVNLRTHIVTTVRGASQEIIDDVREKIWCSKNVNRNIYIPIDCFENEYKTVHQMLSDAFLIIALAGPHPDIRDIMLNVADMVEYAKAKSIDYISIIKDVINYASDFQVLSYPSMKSILRNYVAQKSL